MKAVTKHKIPESDIPARTRAGTVSKVLTKNKTNLEAELHKSVTVTGFKQNKLKKEATISGVG
jgi:hypothetical protein